MLPPLDPALRLALFGALCDLVSALEDLGTHMPPSPHQAALRGIVQRFDELLDGLVALSCTMDDARATTSEPPERE